MIEVNVIRKMTKLKFVASRIPWERTNGYLWDANLKGEISKGSFLEEWIPRNWFLK